MCEEPNDNGLRCTCCKKRVGYLGIKCRCNGVFCTAHMYPENHACTFDYKAAGAEILTKENPVVKRRKIESI